MRIDRFAVRDFRKLAKGILIEGIEAGITIIVGDNEEGKSTLLRALQSAFFDRHNLVGKAIEDMLPFGARGVSPSVEVDFELAGTAYQLQKAFGRNPAVSLRGGGGRLEGEAAEEELRALLGFSPPGRGAADNKHRGPAGLLWVEQGHAFEHLGMNKDTQEDLREAIEGEVGQVLGGERGRPLIEKVEERTREYFTRTDRERERLVEPRNRTKALEEACDELVTELREYDEKVGRLGKLQETLNRYSREGSLARAKDEADAAKEAIQVLKEVEGRVEIEKARTGKAEADWKAAEEANNQRKRLIEAADAASEHAGEAKKTLQELEPAYLDAKKVLAEAEEQLERRLKKREAAHDAWETARRMLERAGLDSKLQALTKRLKHAESLEQGIIQDRHSLDANPVDEESVAELRELRSRQIEVKAALNAAAVAVTFSPQSDQGVVLDGQQVDTGGPAHVTRPSTFQLEGFGEVEVAPGERDIPQLRSEEADLEMSLREKLRLLAQKDLVGTESALRAKQKSQERVSRQRGELAGFAPEGLQALRDDVRDRQARLSALVEQDTGDVPDIETARTLEENAQNHRKDAERAVELALKSRDEAQNLHTKLRQERVRAEAEVEQSAEAVTTHQANLKDARRNASDHELARRTREAANELEQRRSNYETVRAARDAMNPEALHFEQQRTEDAHIRLQEQITKTERDVDKLTVELRTLGQQGLAEQLEEKQGELNAALRDLARTEADAKAWKLLLETLREAEREAKETFLEPVRERLRPYLQMLFPETELCLGEDDFEIVSLRRGEVEEPFTTLSMGAREQVAVLTRLALANLLREKDKPVALILDDPLVNSDDERFRRMALALRKAADSLQILILTCHESRYEKLGAKIIRLAECRTTDQ